MPEYHNIVNPIFLEYVVQDVKEPEAVFGWNNASLFSKTEDTGATVGKDGLVSLLRGTFGGTQNRLDRQQRRDDFILKYGLKLLGGALIAVMLITLVSIAYINSDFP